MDKDKHLQYIDNMCRLCTERALTAKEIRKRKTPLFVSNSSEDVYVFYGIDVSNDSSTVHPAKMCNTCYQTMQNAKNRTTDGLLNRSVL